tara:strand:- start:185 stop:469 length:285 start_codon:yes stop_codon:yes gene_type:complete
MAMTPKQFMEAVYEIAFGHEAYYRGFYPEEVIERLQEFSDGSNPILIEDSINTVEELTTDLKNLSDEDLVQCRQDLVSQTYKIVEALEEIGTDE